MPKMSINKRQLKWVQITLWCCPQLPASRHVFFLLIHNCAGSASCVTHSFFLLLLIFTKLMTSWPQQHKKYGEGGGRENENENNVQSSEGQRQGIVWPLFGTWVKMSLSIYLGKFFKVNACLSTAGRAVEVGRAAHSPLGRSAARPLLSLLLQP